MHLDLDWFEKELAKAILTALRRSIDQFAHETVTCFALDIHPWAGFLNLSMRVDTDECDLPSLADWKHSFFAQSYGICNWPEARPLSDFMEKTYKQFWQTPQNKDASELRRSFFRAAARAMCNPQVTLELEKLRQSQDFLPYVIDPDDPNWVNYCEGILGVDRSKRKAKSEIVNDLEESLNDPQSVRVLKYWFHHEFTGHDDERIAQFTELEILHLCSMGLSELPRCLHALKKIRELDLDGNRIKSLEGLRRSERLELLSLRDNGAMTDAMIDEIANLRSLKELRVGHCGLTEIPQSFQRLRLLEVLLVFGNPLRAIPSWLFSLPHLRKLGLVDAVEKSEKERLCKLYHHIEIW